LRLVRGAALFSAFSAIALLLSAPAFGQQVLPGQTLLEVEAVGRAEAAPDRAVISGGVTSEGLTSREAIAANNQAMANVMAALRAAGVPAGDIRTNSVQISPRYTTPAPGTYRNGPIIGYLASNNILVTVRTIGNTSRFLGAMFESGANQVSGPNFSIDDDSAVIVAARQDAIARARADAESYASGFGMRVDHIVRISERSRVAGYVGNLAHAAPPPPPPPPAPGMDVPIAVGKITQRLTLWVDFALVPR
jgi:hypothetical protein